jgi:hypothetical protein
MFANPLLLLFQPRRAWSKIADRSVGNLFTALLYPLLFAVLPALAWYIGSTHTGWQIGSSDAIRLTRASALPIVVLFYLAMVGAVIGIGCMIHWMAQTYGAASSIAKGIAIAGFTATPLFVAGAVGFYPQLALDLVIGLVALCYAIYLLYMGVPIVMKIPEERGFLFASAVIAVCLVALIAIMGATVMLWDLGVTPTFTD